MYLTLVKIELSRFNGSKRLFLSHTQTHTHVTLPLSLSLSEVFALGTFPVVAVATDFIHESVEAPPPISHCPLVRPTAHIRIAAPHDRPTDQIRLHTLQYTRTHTHTYAHSANTVLDKLINTFLVRVTINHFKCS